MADETFKGFERYRPDLTENEVFFELFGDKAFIPDPFYPEIILYPTIEDLYQKFKERLLTELAKEERDSQKTKP